MESCKSTPNVEFVIQMGKLFGVSMDYLLLGERTQPVHSEVISETGERMHKNSKRNRIVFACMGIIGVILLCLFPLFASMYRATL